MGNFNYILIAIAVAVGPAVRVFLGRRNSKRYSVSTEGAVRVRAPRFPLIAVIILAPVGIALNVVGVFCLWFSIQAWIYSQDTSLFSYSFRRHRHRHFSRGATDFSVAPRDFCVP